MSSEVMNMNQSFTPIKVPTRRRIRGGMNTNSWNNLVELLRSLGVKTGKKTLSLNWETPQESQFDLLMKLMSQLTNINLNGNYSDNTKEWIIGL